MSIKLMTAVWELDLQANLKLLLLAMADIAGDDGLRLYPSIAHVAKKVGSSERQVQRNLRLLIDEGFMSVVANETGGKPGTTRHYSIHLDRLGLPLPTGDKMSLGRVTPTTQRGDAGVTLSVSEPLEEKEPNGSKKVAMEDDVAFATFWESYPKQRAGKRDKALAVWRRVITEGTEPQDIIDGCKAYANSDEVARGYAKGAAAWLNDDRWTNHYGQAPGTTQTKANGVPLLTGRDAQVML